MVIDPTTLSGDKVVFGATVTLKDEDGKKVKYQLVGQTEADANAGRISYNSAARAGADRPPEGRGSRSLDPVGRPLLRNQEDRIHLIVGPNPRTATFAITVLTALAWVVAAALGKSYEAALALGFIPARLSGVFLPGEALPVWLTPLSATLVHSGLIHLGFNLLIFVWCGTLVERILGKAGLVILYVVGAYAAALAQWAVEPHAGIPMVGASGAISAVMGAFALSYGRARMFTRSPAANRWINAVWLLVAWTVLQADDGLSRRGPGLFAGDARAHRRFCGGTGAAAPAAAVEIPEGLKASRWVLAAARSPKSIPPDPARGAGGGGR